MHRAGRAGWGWAGVAAGMLVVAAVVACHSAVADAVADTAADAVADTAADAVADTAADAVADTAADAVADAVADTTRTPPTVGELVHATLDDGRAVHGELVAIYDHRPFWFDPTDRETWALFDAAGLSSTFELDTSFVFVDRAAITEVSSGPLPASVPAYRQALRDQGVVLQRFPLQGVAWVAMAGQQWHLEEDGYGHFAWDIGRTGADGLTYADDGADNADYHVWDDPIAMPASGTLSSVTRDAPDSAPALGDPPLTAVNNGVVVYLSGRFYVQMLHQRQSSIPSDLVPGSALSVGDFIGNVGNAGVTLTPHLHLTALWYDDATQRSWSVPIEFAELYVSTEPAGASHQPFAAPRTGEWVSSNPF